MAPSQLRCAAKSTWRSTRRPSRGGEATLSDREVWLHVMRNLWIGIPVKVRAAAVGIALIAWIGAVLAATSGEQPEVTRAMRPMPPPRASPLSSSPPPISSARPGDVAQLPTTSDPNTYAAAVGELVLGMDPERHEAQAYRQVLLTALDREALGDDFDRLKAATLAWVPDDATWRRQADLDQLTSFRTKDVTEPDRKIFSEGAPLGHEVRTVDGLQEIGYLAEDGSRASSTQARAMSVWMFCPPGDTCGLVAIPDEVLR